jgi:hypothetical protein
MLAKLKELTALDNEGRVDLRRIADGYRAMTDAGRHR